MPSSRHLSPVQQLTLPTHTNQAAVAAVAATFNANTSASLNAAAAAAAAAANTFPYVVLQLPPSRPPPMSVARPPETLANTSPPITTSQPISASDHIIATVSKSQNPPVLPTDAQARAKRKHHHSESATGMSSVQKRGYKRHPKKEPEVDKNILEQEATICKGCI
ncbi:hypothetical protein BJ742DRAFT_778214 [Cladochytrium replicatum]|nr:hypothetical protein BJ742DRAFT_778214 [Cladochytrium replicatum]